MTFALSSARKVSWNLAGVPGGIPTATPGKSVTVFGARGNGAFDDTSAFEAAIKDCAGTAAAPVALLVPQGTYKLTRVLKLKTGCVLRGAGSNSTELVSNLGKLADASNIEIAASTGSSAWTYLSSGYTKGSTAVVVSSNAAYFKVGDVVEIQQANIAALLYTSAAFNVTWAQNAIGEIAVVSRIVGNTITLDRALHFTYTAAQKPQIRKLAVIKAAGVEYMTLRREDAATDKAHSTGSVTFSNAYGCWMYRCESDTAVGNHVYFNRSLRNELRQCYYHHAWHYSDAEGGGGVGLKAVYHSTLNLVSDCIAQKLNSFTFGRGANGNVVSYSASMEPYDSRPNADDDYDMHGHHPWQNLCEGNDMEWGVTGSFWGPGPNNTWFRNNVRRRITIADHSHNCNVIGNELNGSQGEIAVSAAITGTLIHQNEVKGTVTAAGGEDTSLPASLFLTSKPAWWDDSCPWPAYGPDVAAGAIPARRRWDSKQYVPQAGTYTPPPNDEHPVVSGGSKTVDIHPASKVFALTFKATPLTVNEDVCLALSYSLAPTQPSIFSTYACTVRFYTNGKIEARDETTYRAVTDVSYTKDTEYSFRFVVDLVNHTYDAYVDGIPLAIRYAFRSTVAKLDNIDTFNVNCVAGDAMVTSLAVQD